MKTFDDNLEVVEVKLKDKDGNEKILKARFMSVKDMKKLDEITNSKKEHEDGFDIMCKRMVYIFGGKEGDYYKYSFSLLNGVMDYVKDVYLINPMKPVQTTQK